MLFRSFSLLTLMFVNKIKQSFSDFTLVYLNRTGNRNCKDKCVSVRSMFRIELYF